jgi:hypothetical protein
MKPGRVSRFFPGFGFGNGWMPVASPSQNDLPVATVKKNLLKRLFLPKYGGKNRVFSQTIFVWI